MAWAKSFYSGPATAVSINSVNYGDCENVIIKWEPTGPETMDKAQVQTGGIGTFEAKAMKAGTNSLALLTGRRNTDTTIIVTTPLATYTMSNQFIEYGFSGALSDPGKTTTFDLKASKWTATPDSFVVVVDV